MCRARRGQLHGRGDGPPPSSPRASATAGPHWQPYRERLVSRRVALFDRPGGEKCRPCARSQASRGRRDASDECARGDPTLVPDVEATVSSDNENKDMLGSEQGGGRSPPAPGPRACRRHGARRLIICAARTGRSLAARARRRLSGGKCDCGRGALRSVVLLEKARDNTVAAAATPHDRGGRGDRVQGRRRRLWSSSRVRCYGRRRGHDGRQRAAVVSDCPWPHCCQRGAARTGHPTHCGK